MKKLILFAFALLSATSAFALPGRQASYVQQQNGSVYQVSGGQVLQNGYPITVGGIVTEIVVDRATQIYGLGTDGQVYLMPRPYSPWIQVTYNGIVTHFSLSRGLIYGIGTDGNQYCSPLYQSWRRCY